MIIMKGWGWRWRLILNLKRVGAIGSFRIWKGWEWQGFDFEIEKGDGDLILNLKRVRVTGDLISNLKRVRMTRNLILNLKRMILTGEKVETQVRWCHMWQGRLVAVWRCGREMGWVGLEIWGGGVGTVLTSTHYCLPVIRRCLWSHFFKWLNLEAMMNCIAVAFG